jgi:hypothetical protein
MRWVTNKRRCDILRCMSRLKSVEEAITSLSESEFSAFRRWFEEYQEQRFDERIERDAKAGKLDALAQKAIEDDKAGRTRPL